jgi:hypothetical protein
VEKCAPRDLLDLKRHRTVVPGQERASDELRRRIRIADLEKRRERRADDADLLGELAACGQLVVLPGSDDPADGHVPEAGIDVLGLRAAVDEKVALTVPDQQIHGAVQEIVAPHFGPGHLAHDPVVRVDDVDELACGGHDRRPLGERCPRARGRATSDSWRRT